MDWLDFKCSCARAMLIAHQVLKVLIASHTDSGLAASAALAASGNGALRHLTAAPTVAGFSAAAAAAIAMRAVAAEQLGRGDHADHLPPIHAHYPTRQHHQQHAGASVRFDVSAAAGTRPTGAGPAAGAGGPGGDTGGAAPPTEEHTELTDKKWSGVQVGETSMSLADAQPGVPCTQVRAGHKRPPPSQNCVPQSGANVAQPDMLFTPLSKPLSLYLANPIARCRCSSAAPRRASRSPWP